MSTVSQETTKSGAAPAAGAATGAGAGATLSSGARTVGYAAGSQLLRPASASAAPSTTYTVRPGDTLSGIAQRFYGDPQKWTLIQRANPVLSNPNMIHAGQVLTIPDVAPQGPAQAPPTQAPPTQAPPTQAPPAPPMNDASYYVVRGGDSLSAIAGRLLGDASRWREIYDANRNILSSPSLLQPGQRLLVPGWRGGETGPPTQAPPAPGGSGGSGSATPENIRRVAMQITTVMETGGLEGYAAINDYDAGIISYGRHQATLAGGALAALLDAYLATSHTDTARQLSGYMDRVRRHDASLRDNEAFKTLLRAASVEPEMQAAQDSAIIASHYEPAARTANEWGVQTPLGVAMLYDTNIQGGLASCLRRAVSVAGGRVGAPASGGGLVTGAAFLRAFNDERKARLLELANAAGNTAQGRALRTSVYRCDEFAALLASGNLQLVGTLHVRGNDIEGLAPP